MSTNHKSPRLRIPCDREPTLRHALLRTLDALFEDPERGAAFTPWAGEVIDGMLCHSLSW